MASDNASALHAGMAKAKAAISADLTSRLDRLMSDMVSSMHTKMTQEVPGMTGNTRVSPAGAVYANGQIQSIDLGQERKAAIRVKLNAGEKFHAGKARYDGDVQEHTFKATVPTTREFQINDNYSFLESLQSGNSEFKATVIGATEYLGHQQVHDNFAKCQDEIAKYFKPSK